MSLTFIDTNKLSKKTTAGHGDFTEILNRELVRRAQCARLGSLAESREKRSSRKASIGISSFI